MQCPNCGRHTHEKSVVCDYCGQQIEQQKRGIRKHFIAIFLIAVVALSLFHFLRYDTERADKLVRAATIEMERGNGKLQEVESTLHTLREVKFDAPDSIPREKTYAFQSRESISHVLPHLDESMVFFERAEELLKRTDSFDLPARYQQYVATEMEVVQRYKEYVTALRTLCDNLLLYYEFAEHYCSGEHSMTSIMKDMDRGNDNLERGDYDFAAAAYELCLHQLQIAQEEYTHASKAIDFSYITDLISNLTHLERALHDLSEAAHQMDQEKMDLASLLAELGAEEGQLIVRMDRLQLKTQIAEWYALHVTDIMKKIDALKAEIETLQEEAEAAWR